jgi:hypothetical protein
MYRSLVGTMMAAAFLAACERPASHFIAPTVALSTGVGHMATGSGIIDAGEGLRNLTFHAVQNPNGSVSGSYRILRTDLSTEFAVDVTCLTVVGNQAWIGGRISFADSPGIVVGTISYFYAIDNGEGEAAAADLISLARVNDREGEDLLFCRDRPTLLPSRVVQYGNVQVR